MPKVGFGERLRRGMLGVAGHYSGQDFLGKDIQSRKQKVRQEMLMHLAEQNPEMMESLGIDIDRIGEFSPQDVLTMSQIQKAAGDREAQQAYMDLVDRYSGEEPGVKPPPLPGSQIQQPGPPTAGPQAPPVTSPGPEIETSGSAAFDAFSQNEAVRAIPPTELGITGFGPRGATIGQTSESEMEQEIYQKSIQAGIELDKSIKTTQNKKLSDKYGQTARVIQSMRNLMGLGRAIDDDPEIDTGAYAQVVADASQFRYTPSWLQNQAEPFQAYVAQMQEVKLSALPILSGQARYVVDLAKAIQQTVPRVGLVKSNRETLVSQTVRNMMTLTYAIQNGYLGADNLRQMGVDPNGSPTNEEAQALLNSVQLSSKQESAITDAVDYVLSAPAIKKGKQVRPGPAGVSAKSNSLVDTYMQKYPGRTRDEVIRAINRQGVDRGR